MVENEAPAPAPAAPAAAPAKKSNATTIIIIVVVAVVVLGIGGTLISRWVARKAADKIAGGLLGAATGSSVSVNSDTGAVSVKTDDGSTQIGGNISWPSSMPSEIPKYSKGKITSATSGVSGDGTGWSITISETSQSDFDAYKASLISDGWALTTTSNFGAEIDVYEKGAYDLNLTWDPTSKGVLIGVTPKS